MRAGADRVSPREDNALPRGMSIGAVNLRLAAHEFHDTANSFAIIDADHTATPYFSQATHCTRGSKPTRHYDGSSLQPADSVIVTEPMVFYGPTYWRRLFPAGMLLFIAPTYGTWEKSALSRPVCAGWAWADGGHPLRGPHVS